MGLFNVLAAQPIFVQVAAGILLAAMAYWLVSLLS